jgi:hypothetical protein
MQHGASPRLCVFCGTHADSKEHAFPRWLNRVVPGEAAMLHGRERSGTEWQAWGAARPREMRDIWTRIRPVSKGEWPPGRWLVVDDLATLAGGRFIPMR